MADSKNAVAAIDRLNCFNGSLPPEAVNPPAGVDESAVSGYTRAVGSDSSPTPAGGFAFNGAGRLEPPASTVGFTGIGRLEQPAVLRGVGGGLPVGLGAFFVGRWGE